MDKHFHMNLAASYILNNAPAIRAMNAFRSYMGRVDDFEMMGGDINDMVEFLDGALVSLTRARDEMKKIADKGDER